MANPITGAGLGSAFNLVKGTPAEAAAITYLIDLGQMLDAQGDGNYTLIPHCAEAPNVIEGRIPREFMDDRWEEYTGKPSYTKGHMKFIDVAYKQWWRGRTQDYNEWQAYGALRGLLKDVQAPASTDAALPARLAQAALDAGTSTDADKIDFDGLAYFVTGVDKPFNPFVPGLGKYRTSFSGSLTDENVRAALDNLYLRRDPSGEPLKLWNYGVELWHCLELKTTADDICKIADLIPKAGPGGDDTGGNTNTVAKRGIIPKVLEHTNSTASSGAWYLQSLHPACKPFVKASPPDPRLAVFFARGQDPSDINSIKAGFLDSIGVRMLTTLGTVKYTY